MDELDKKIIRILQRDARLPFTKIAKELDQPDTTVHFRTRRLLKAGVITRFSALVNPPALGFTVSALLKIQIGGHILPEISLERTQSFAEELGMRSDFCWVAISEEPMTIYALMLAEDDSSLQQQVEELRKRPDVSNVGTTLIHTITKGGELTGGEILGGDDQ
ncbi:MAG: AsnC family transcriptional regulator [Candidatus Thorarchaeota archaeon]|nr:AsnC family transcriptional regulator [Candidatus Thorarchaeota archaeon]